MRGEADRFYMTDSVVGPGVSHANGTPLNALNGAHEAPATRLNFGDVSELDICNSYYDESGQLLFQPNIASASQHHLQRVPSASRMSSECDKSALSGSGTALNSLNREDSFAHIFNREDSYFHLPLWREDSVQNLLNKAARSSSGGLVRDASVHNLLSLTRTNSFKDVLDDLWRKTSDYQRRGGDEVAQAHAAALHSPGELPVDGLLSRQPKAEDGNDAQPILGDSRMAEEDEDEEDDEDSDSAAPAMSDVNEQVHDSADGVATAPPTAAADARPKSRKAGAGGGRTDIRGTTAAKSRKMSMEEKLQMLQKRKLRNRQSAARSRQRHRQMLQDVIEEIDGLEAHAQSMLQHCEVCWTENQKLREENLDFSRDNTHLRMQLARSLGGHGDNPVNAESFLAGASSSSLRSAALSASMSAMTAQAMREAKQQAIYLQPHPAVSTSSTAQAQQLPVHAVGDHAVSAAKSPRTFIRTAHAAAANGSSLVMQRVSQRPIAPIVKSGGTSTKRELTLAPRPMGSWFGASKRSGASSQRCR